MSIAWSAQPATHERAARAAEAPTSFLASRARSGGGGMGGAHEGAHAAMPGALDPLRVGEHVRALPPRVRAFPPRLRGRA